MSDIVQAFQFARWLLLEMELGTANWMYGFQLQTDGGQFLHTDLGNAEKHACMMSSTNSKLTPLLSDTSLLSMTGLYGTTRNLYQGLVAHLTKT